MRDVTRRDTTTNESKHFKKIIALAVSHLAEVEGVEGEVSGLAVLLVHVDDGGEQEDLREREPEEELPHGALLHLLVCCFANTWGVGCG